MASSLDRLVGHVALLDHELNFEEGLLLVMLEGAPGGEISGTYAKEKVAYAVREHI